MKKTIAIIMTMLMLLSIAPITLASDNGEGKENDEVTTAYKEGGSNPYEEYGVTNESKKTRVTSYVGLSQEHEQNTSKLIATLSNGRNAEVKVMPTQAAETALTRLRLKLCEECSIELKEVGKGNQSRLAYEIKTTKNAKLFGLFQVRMGVEAQVDAENGEIIQVKKRWWAFLATEPAETSEEPEKEENDITEP